MYWCLSGSLEGEGTCGEVNHFVVEASRTGGLNEQEMGNGRNLFLDSFALIEHLGSAQLSCASFRVLITWVTACLQIVLIQDHGQRT